MTHSLCWAMGKSDWAHYPLLRTDTGSARRGRERASSPAHCEWTPSPVLSLSGVCGHLPRLSLSNLALLCLLAFVRWKQMSTVSSHRALVQWGMDVGSRDYWHALSHPLGWLVNKKGWMTDTVKGMKGSNVHVSGCDWWYTWWTLHQAGFFLSASKWGINGVDCRFTLLPQMKRWSHVRSQGGYNCRREVTKMETQSWPHCRQLKTCIYRQHATWFLCKGAFRWSNSLAAIWTSSAALQQLS